MPKPGEVTLAHRGVLFLDEFPEFDRRVIDSLRQPLEDRKVSVSRAKGTASFPSNFILVAAMNPCPCGNYGIRGKECLCSPIQISRYQRKVSGPIIDRVDLWVEVSKVDHVKLGEKTDAESETDILRSRIEAARAIQQKRFEARGLSIRTNSEIPAKDIVEIIPMDPSAKEVLNRSAQQLDLSARTYHRIMKLAQTIADLEGDEIVNKNHILEALQYRPKQQK